MTGAHPSTPPDPAFERAFREESGRALATVARIVGDLQLAEDAVQEAFVDAMRTWPGSGVPRNPGAWITTVARNRALDRIRRESQRDAKEFDSSRLAQPNGEGEEVWPVRDDQLRLVFTCCHPALSREAQVALTLRLVCGLTAAEIARAFLQTESTVTRRLTRAKSKIRDAAIPFRLPPEHLLPERVPQVLACIYLVFTEGYSATPSRAGEATRTSAGPSIRADLCEEAIRLGRLLTELMPDEPDAWALQALMLLQDSRRAERLDADGAARPLEEQDRSRWDRRRIEDGTRCLLAARRSTGSYLPQAIVAAAHARAETWEDTDWSVIAGAYERLFELTGSPVVAVNRAVAVGFRDGYERGLAVLDEIDGDPRLDRLVRPVRADLLRRAGRQEEAELAYLAALELPSNDAVERFLRRRLSEVRSARQR
ncbi:sigma-70 family RNA polymerase sigma factor [Rhodococcus spelaei]|uniref:Sigma-70 family RNA polymerase sigma factor n=1 Tax=Rhodococcus spelaei TaxID=2546320 RepID=A0A541BRW4_9NOCA|nr:sigma-70 family RNA polymerase sigma factor [Rhodococcus spelaei]TQF75009.1 sigma-70 family RNA polymerase sigma factor [Rhodococcus spelaei]